ncbi:hypothetical protein GLOTRDRAFT_114844 [Gloeophyllum trabeum ATCC 11539]|uniref:Protein N-terminal glutamine amidohydrolase n=1 Tax=Gloeophyllum trabeum (strain ATCC 11539 / FP-39264 / Madison 617) TaxID=670483 RepID=S7RYD4_GLOTA|nr:uncharacterized protein GLOTRDRAFT_114844 [Gloeophyllum trabeum ATCC 11539]EPQ58414.1 hypothetical protein GLOTRDRAFT_114844 [Gloeophyllum trabeum ATCC 11539]
MYMPTSGLPRPPRPPALPCDSVYTRCYCEENIYLLAANFEGRNDVKDRWETFVIFISNPRKTVALWNQTAREGIVVWDYHVILVLRPRPAKIDRMDRSHDEEDAASWVYDFDTQLPRPCTAKDYIAGTFPSGDELPTEYQSLFRVIPAQTYLDNFASDRSHMNARRPLAEALPQYVSPPPEYAPICGPLAKQKGLKTNLMDSFVHDARRAETYGSVLAPFLIFYA